MPNYDMILKTLKFIGIDTNHVTELRMLNVRNNQHDSYTSTFGGYFDNCEQLAKAACQIKYASGYYIIPNPCHPDVMARYNNRVAKLGKGEGTSDGDILSRKWLLIDADPVRLARVSSTNEEHESAIQRVRLIVDYLDKRGWPRPIIADSGNGGHLLYKINLERDDMGLVENFLKTLDKLFSDESVKIDTSVHNPARIWKLYGTPARKGDSTSNRPHRMAKILEIPDGY